MISRTPTIPLLLTLICGLVSPAVGQGGPHAQEALALGFVQRIAEGDTDATMAYIEQTFGSELLERRPLDQWQGIAKQLQRHAGLEVVGLDIHGPERVVVEAQSPAGMILSFGFDFTPEEPDKIGGLSIEAGGGHSEDSNLPPFEVPPGADLEAVKTALREYFDLLDRDDLFSGAAIVAHKGEPIFRGAWGLASREWDAPNTLDTRFALGSINKSFTKIAIGQLALAGKLSLDDKIVDHLPDYPNTDVAKKVKIRQLVDHTSGIGDIFNDKFFNSSRALYREPSDFFPVFADEPLLFEPGESSAYSNGGYMVLGAIIAAASDQTYSEYVNEHIFEPAGMASTGFFARDEIHPNIAVGYTKMGFDGPGDELRNNLFMMAVRGSSAGNAYATVDDMLRFDEALREHELLPPAWTRWYFGGDEPSNQDAEGVSRTRAMTGIGIAGGAPGVSAVVESDGLITVIVLSNVDEPGAMAVSRALRRPLAQALRAHLARAAPGL